MIQPSGSSLVGIEIRQNTAAQRAETRQGLANASRDMILAVAGDPELARVWFARWRSDRNGGDSGAQLSPTDSMQAETLMHATLRNMENGYFQASEGVVDFDVPGTYGWNTPMFRNAEFWAFRDEKKPEYDPRFVEAFEEANRTR